MTGSIRRKGASKWELRVSAGSDPVTRKPRQVSRTFKGTKRDAEKRLRALVVEVDEGRHRSTEATVGYLLEQWWEHASPGWAPKTRERNRGIIDSRLVPALGTIRLSQLGPGDLDRMYRDLLRKGLSPATVRKVHAVMSRALSQGVRWRWLVANPATMASPPRVDQRAIQPPSAAQVQEIIADIQRGPRPELATLVWLAAATGARRGELCGLRWSDLDDEVGTLRIVRSITQVGAEITVKSTKTHQERSVGLDQDEVDMLVAHRALMVARAATFGVRLAAGAFIFSDEPDGAQPWSPVAVSNIWRKLCTRRGMKGLRFHDLRHFSATELLTAGVPIRTVSGRLGHRRTSTTSDTYVAWVPASDRDAARIIGDRLRPPRPEDAPSSP